MNLTFFCINNLYLEPAKVAVASFKKVNPSIPVMVFHTPDVDAEKFKADLGKLEIETQVLNPMDSSWHKSSVFAPDEVNGALLRLAAIDYIDTQMPDVRLALYLDSDTVCVRPMSGVWAAPLRNSFVAAALDYPALPEMEHLYKLHPDWDRRIDINDNYFNSGVMLLNMPRIREVFKGKLEQGFKDRYDPSWKQDDQDYLNMVFSEGVATLIMPRFFNFMPEIQMFRHMSSSMLIGQRDLGAKALLFHYAGKLKPWSQPRLIPDERAGTIRYDVYYSIVKRLQVSDVRLDNTFVGQVQVNADLTSFVGKFLRDYME